MEQTTPKKSPNALWRVAVLLALLLVLLAAVTLEGVWIRDLNSRLDRICYESRHRLGGPVMAIGEAARAADHGRYLDLLLAVQGDLDVVRRCPVTAIAQQLYDDLSRLVNFGAFKSSGLWDNQSALLEFGQSLEQIGEHILLERPFEDVAALATELISRLEGMGYVVP